MKKRRIAIGKPCIINAKFALIMLLCALNLFAFAGNSPENTEEPIMRTLPYLQNPTNTEITVSWLTHAWVHSWVEYGENPEQLVQRAETWLDGQVLCYNKQHMIRLKDLKPGTTYYYRTCSREITLYKAYKKEFGNTEYSEIYSFTTPDPNNTDFTALVFNDLHKNKKTLNRLMKQVEGTNYDFVFFNGDCIDDPEDEATVLDYLTYTNESVQAQNYPVFYIRGNHEIRNAYSIRLRDLIDYVGGETTYGAFSWGDTRFVLLDCGEDKPDTTWVYYGLNSFESFRLEQCDFLKEELAGSAFKNAQKRVLIHHIPIYGFEDRYLPCKELWHPLLTDAPFSIAINAHVHEFSYHPKQEETNNFPVVIGGGPRENTATVMILRKRNQELTLEVLDDTGKQLLMEIL